MNPDQHHHTRHQGNNILVLTPVHGSAKGKCGLLREQDDHRMKHGCSHLGLHLLNFNIHAYRLRASGPKSNNNKLDYQFARSQFDEAAIAGVKYKVAFRHAQWVFSVNLCISSLLFLSQYFEYDFHNK